MIKIWNKIEYMKQPARQMDFFLQSARILAGKQKIRREEKVTARRKRSENNNAAINNQQNKV